MDAGVSTFDHDLFISYAHIDDQALEEGKEGWIAALHRVLEVRLAQLLGKKPKIWRDPKLQGNDFFDDTIVEQLDSAAVLISVISPRYVQSEWCRKEAAEFVRKAAETGGLRVGDKARTFKVVKTPVPLEQHPEGIQGLLGYEFFELDRDSGRPRELGPRFGPDAERQYWARLEDLAYDIRDLLAELESSSPQQASTGPTAAPDGAKTASGRTVYLAETTHDLREERDQIRRALLDQGHTVLPDQSLPLVGPELEARVAADLESCDLSIHLIGESYGIVPEASTRSVAELQNVAAAERSEASGLARLIWMPPGLVGSDERQQGLIDRLINDESAQQGADLIQARLEELKTIIVDRLSPRPEPESPVVSSSEARPPLLYLIADRDDQEAIAELEDFFFEQGFEVTLPLFEGDETEARLDHEENLRLADAVLIYHGNGSEAWLRGKLRDLRKAPGFGRDAPFRAKAVYLAPPETPRKARFRSHEVEHVLVGFEGFDPEIVRPLLQSSRAGAAEAEPRSEGGP